MIKALKHSARSLALFLLLSGAAHASIFDYGFSVSGSWFDNGGNPYGLSYSPSLTGTVQVDNSLSGLAAVTGFSFTTGSKTWSLADVDTGGTTFNGFGILTKFNVQFSDATGNGYVYSNNTVAVFETGRVIYNACNDCVSLGQGVPVAAIPEPETYALMMAGLGLLSFVARRRKLRELT